MTREELIEQLHTEQELLDSEWIKDYEEEYQSIWGNVMLLCRDNKCWKGKLDCYFEQFIPWDDVRTKLLFAVDDRDSRTLTFLTRDVDLDANYYYVDDFGYLQNIDKDILLILIERLLQRLEEE